MMIAFFTLLHLLLIPEKKVKLAVFYQPLLMHKSFDFSPKLKTHTI